MKPRSLSDLIEAKRAEVAQQQAELRAAWTTEGATMGSIILRCWAFHQQCQQWNASTEELRQLERQARGEELL